MYGGLSRDEYLDGLADQVRAEIRSRCLRLLDDNVRHTRESLVETLWREFPQVDDDLIEEVVESCIA